MRGHRVTKRKNGGVVWWPVAVMVVGVGIVVAVAVVAVAGVEPIDLRLVLVAPLLGVDEELQPRAEVTPRLRAVELLVRRPAVRNGAQDTLRVRHHGGDATVLAAHGGDRVRRAVGVGREALRGLALRVDVAQRDVDSVDVALVAELGTALAVRHDDGDGGALHALEEDRLAALLHLRHAHTRLVLRALVVRELRPLRRARHKVPQGAEHLATVAHTQGERVLAVEEGLELLGSHLVALDRAGPTPAGTERVAVRESTAARDTAELAQAHGARQHVAHVNVVHVESSAAERPRHLNVAVHALLPQDRHVRRVGDGRNRLRDVERQLREETRVLLVQDGVVLLLRALLVVAHRLHQVRRLGPHALQLRTRPAHGLAAARPDHDRLLLRHLADHRHGGLRQALGDEGRLHGGGVRRAHLQGDAKLLGEHEGEHVRVARRLTEVDVHAAPAGDAHLREGGGDATVGAVVVGEDGLGLAQGRQRLREGDDGLRRHHVGRLVAHLLVALREDAGAQAPLAGGQVDEEDRRLLRDLLQVRRQRVAHVADGREGGDDHGEGGDNLLLLAVLVRPDGLHRHRVLADRDRDAQLRCEVHSDALARLVQVVVLLGGAGVHHPVRREAHVGQGLHVAREHVRERLADGEAGAGRAVQGRHRRALADGHGLADEAVVRRGGDGDVRERHLPLTDHLVARDEARHGAVADGDEEVLARHRRVGQHAQQSLVRRLRQLQRLAGGRARLDVLGHARGLTEQSLHGKVHRVVVEERVVHDQALLRRGLADHRVDAALPLAQRLQGRQTLVVARQHVTLLRFVAPDLHRAHALLAVRHLAQVDDTAVARVVQHLRDGVAETAGTHVVDEQDRVRLAQRPARVDHLLATPLQLRVVALHRREVDALGGRALRHGAGGTAAQPDEHRGPAQHHDVGAGGHRLLLDVLVADVAEATRQHDRLVVALHLALSDGLQEAAEVATDVRAAELVVERGAADRALEHDLHGGGDLARLADLRLLPRALGARDVQVRHAEAGETRLRLAADAGGALVTDLAAVAGGGAGVRGDGGRVVVRLDLADDVDGLLDSAVLLRLRVREEAAGGVALQDGGVVLVRREHALRVALVRVLDHLEERVLLLHVVDGPLRVEDLVPAVLRVHLSEHHQLDVRRVARPRAQDVLHLVGLDREAELHVRRLQRLAIQRHARQLLRLQVLEQHVLRHLRRLRHDRLRHPVVDDRRGRGELLRRQHAVELPLGAVLDARNRRRVQAEGEDLRRLAGEGRLRARARDDRHVRLGLDAGHVVAVVQALLDGGGLLGGEARGALDEVDVVDGGHGEALHRRGEHVVDAGERGLKLGRAEMRLSLKDQHGCKMDGTPLCSMSNEVQIL
eukprot:Rhum_TRINITY_DN15543_c0_g1::Rhum_TRINITY_DN15543_c0_g1_i1::g.161066::m.161066